MISQVLSISSPSRNLTSDLSVLPSTLSSTPGGTLFSTTPGGTRITYDRKFLLEHRDTQLSRTPPSDLPLIPGVTVPKKNHKQLSPPKKVAINCNKSNNYNSNSNSNNSNSNNYNSNRSNGNAPNTNWRVSAGSPVTNSVSFCNKNYHQNGNSPNNNNTHILSHSPNNNNTHIINNNKNSKRCIISDKDHHKHLQQQEHAKVLQEHGQFQMDL